MMVGLGGLHTAIERFGTTEPQLSRRRAFPPSFSRYPRADTSWGARADRALSSDNDEIQEQSGSPVTEQMGTISITDAC